MKPFIEIHGVALPMMMADIDTDQMINRDFLITKSRAGLGRGLFYDLRYRDGVEIADFVMNQPWARAPKILVAGPNFACGSSREHAVWSVLDYGIRAVVAPSFGVHFKRNALKNGLLPVTLSLDECTQLASASADSHGERKVKISLQDQIVVLDQGPTFHFDVDDEAKAALLQGLDEIGQTLRHAEAISAFQRSDLAVRPWVYL
jgi:3-isopropylmalate dehydratase small subunit